MKNKKEKIELEKLLPCPFCGQEDPTLNRCNTTLLWHSECRFCCARTGWHLEMGGAIKSWNKRKNSN